MKFVKAIFLTPCFLLLSCNENEPTPDESSSSFRTEDSLSKGSVESSPKREITRSNRTLQNERAQITSAQTVMGQLTTACEDYYEEYQQLPLGSITNSDSAQITTTPSTSPQVGSPFMAALLGLKSAEEENYKLTSFFYCKMAKEQKDGLHRIENAAELFDPWGNPYHLVLNYDYDQELREPLAIGNDILYDRKVLIWSTGPDGKSGSDETNEDNIYNWAKSK